MGKVVVQIGWYRLRDKSTKRFLPAAPLFKKVSPHVAEALAERTATLLVDCYNDYEKSKNFDFNAENNLSENYIKQKILVPPN